MENNDQKTAGISKTLLVLDAFMVLLVALLFLLIYAALHKPAEKSAELSQKISISRAFSGVVLEAKAAYVFDLSKNEVIFEKNKDSQLPLASLTKLMMALTATDLLPSNSHITIRKEFLQEDGDTGLLSEESWKLKDLLDFSLVVSSNDGARSIASVVGAMDLKTTDYDLGRKDFITKMNETAQKIGLNQTYFLNESGLDEGGISGGYGSAEDMGKLMQYILTNKPELLEATKYQEIDISSANKTHTAKNTNEDIDLIPGLIASKTGFTSLAGGNLAVAFDASIGRPMIVVVLGSTEIGRFKDVSLLVKATLDYIRD
jgi:D-alanyl-D-alanine carboxypeptidase (penicillin-binding protein 5/6)